MEKLETEIEQTRAQIKALEPELQEANALFMDLIGMPGMRHEIAAVAKKRRDLHRKINRMCRKLEVLRKKQLQGVWAQRRGSKEEAKMKPRRIQRKRARGWRKPEGAIYVGRPTKYANYADWRELGRDGATEDFRRQLANWQIDDPIGFQQTLDELRSHDLICWCPLNQPCHADVWLELANDSQ